MRQTGGLELALTITIVLQANRLTKSARLTRNPEIGNVCVLPNIWRLGQVTDTKFGTNVSNKMLLNTAKCQNYSFYFF